MNILAILAEYQLQSSHFSWTAVSSMGGGGGINIQKFKQCPPGTTSFIAIKIHYGTCSMIVEFLPDHEILMLHIKI